MPLDNNAKISDIISALQSMQGINQKAELASVIGAPATSEDNIATQIAKLQDAKDILAGKLGLSGEEPITEMVEDLTMGKKWARGTVTIATAAKVFNLAGGTNQVCHYVDIPPLSFTPSKIEIKTILSNGQQGSLTVYDKDPYFPSLDVKIILIPTYYVGTNSNNLSIKLTGNAIVSSAGSCLPVHYPESINTWTAWE